MDEQQQQTAETPTGAASALDDGLERFEAWFDAWFDAEYPADAAGIRDKYRASSVISLMRASWSAGIAAGREACAAVCRDEANRIEAEARRIADEEPEEVSSLLSTAWKLRVTECLILKRSNAEVTGGPLAARPID